MSGEIGYHYGTIADAIGSIDTAIGRMNTSLDDVEGAVKPIEASWTSEARDAYQLRRDAWTKASQEIATLLGQVKTSLQTASDNMSATDRKAATYFVAG